MKNKMKLWRREARKHNDNKMWEEFEVTGKFTKVTHQGRRNKLLADMTHARGVSGLMQVLFDRAGILNIATILSKEQVAFV